MARKHRLSLRAILPVALLVGGFQPASSTETRVASMGGVGPYLRDNSNVFAFPGTISRYAGEAIAELRVRGEDEQYTAGAQVRISPSSVAGLYLNRAVAVVIPPEVGAGIDAELDRGTTLLYGRRLAGVDWGAGLTVGLDGSDLDGPLEMTESASYLALAAGMSSERVDASFSLETPSATRETEGETRSWDGFGGGLAARAFLGSGERLRYVVHGRWRTLVTEAEDESAGLPDASIDYTQTDLTLGLGLTCNIDADNMVVGVLELVDLYQLRTEEDGAPENITRVADLPGLRLGLESRLRSWLLARVGAAQRYRVRYEKADAGEITSERTVRDLEFNMSFGLGLTFGSFLLDASIHEELFFDGPNFISGQSSAVADRLSLSYTFD